MLEKEYSVYFKIKPWYFGLQCLIHMTNRNDVGYYGERTPGVFLFENGEVHIGSAVNGEYNYGTNTEKIPLYEWSSLQIMQTQTNGTYFYKVYLNGIKIFSIINTKPQSFENVKVYSGDPWYNHGNVSIEDLRIKTGNGSLWAQWGEWSCCNASSVTCRNRNCSFDKPNDCVENDAETKSCNFSIIDVTNTLWKVLNTITLQGYLLTINLQIYPTFEASINTRVEFEYLLTPHFSLTSENVVQKFVKADNDRFKYNFKITTNSSDSFNFTFIATFNDTQCPKSGIFTFDIPLKIKTQVGSGKDTVFFKTIKKIVECFAYPKIPVVVDNLVLKESYGRGIYWDAYNFNIYVCMNQHFPSSSVACYISNDDGSSWYELDVQIGSILGHHLLTKELYAIHRNQKLYMMFHNSYNKWLSITNNQFQSASRYIDSTLRINLEGNYNQIHTLGPNQWLGNAQGLFFRIRGNNSWVLRIRWHF
ncbi:uncharacterized protein LOC105847524 isoform X1 [Hydra vulgaris]|uniref:uncharacterized protein LOC105847524 isoform X1 n=1 Tax=Hydra vulgaris TaxID=6087 RepID=UPI0032E9D73C